MSENSSPPRSRVWLFRLAALAIPLMGLGVVELGLRLAQPEFDPYVQLRNQTSVFTEVEIKGQRYIQVTHPEAYSARRTRFLAEKPEGTLRVFCFGGSASAGWPHPPGEIYSAYLESALEAAYRGQEVEVLNLSAHAHASYRVRRIFEDVIDYDPDLVVLYTGNNDFLERRSYWTHSREARSLDRFARNLRVVHALRSLGSVLAPAPDTLDGRTAWAHNQEATLSFVQKTAAEIRADPEQFEAVKEHYRHSVEAMVRMAEERDVPSVVLTVPVNLADWKPNVSRNRLEGTRLSEWEDHYRRGRRHLLDEEWSEGLASLDRALELEPEHAESHFHRARALLSLERPGEARAAFVAAKDLDLNPFRALSEFNQSLREIAAMHPRTTLVDAEALFAREAERGAPGFDLFLDYVHPTKPGNKLLARSVFQAVIKGSLLGPPRSKKVQARFGRPAYRDDRDFPMQAIVVWLLGLNRQEEAMLAKARELRALAATGYPGMKPEEIEEMQLFLDEIEAAVPARVELQARELRGQPIEDAERQRIEEAANAFYARHYGGERRPWKRHRIWAEPTQAGPDS